MLTIAGGILIAAAVLAALPLIFWAFVWLVTGRGRPPLTQTELETRKAMKRSRNVRDLKRLAVTLSLLTLFIIAMAIRSGIR